MLQKIYLKNSTNVLFFCFYAKIKNVKEICNMKKCLGLFVATIAALSLFGTSVQAKDFAVAIVDVPQVVNASAQVQALKKDQQAKADELVKLVEKARKDIAAITDADKKKSAEEKYAKEIQAKKDKIDKDYAEKLKSIDTSITKQIETQANAKGYDLVLSKGFVLYGGTDITADIIKVVK
jgi:outer membrane protein